MATSTNLPGELLAEVSGCCPPVSDAPLAAPDAERLAALLKAVADPARLRLLSLIAASPDGEACVCDLTEPLGLSQPTVSHHLKVLRTAGIVRRDKRGVWAYYRLSPQALTVLAGVFSRDVAPAPDTR